MENLKEVLKECTIDGNNIKPPSAQIDRKLYVELKKTLENSGGKWKGGKVFAFEFPHSPADILAQLCNGEKKNIRQDFQFFPTPPHLVDKLCSLVDWDQYEFASILEPSAGQGHIIHGIRRQGRKYKIFCCELMDLNRDILKKEFGDSIHLYPENDFMDLSPALGYEVIIANPPFTKGQDIDHLRKMYYHLREGGTMVCMTSKSWEYNQTKKYQAFRDWLMDIEDCQVIDVDAGEFKSSGTTIATNIIVIKKTEERNLDIPFKL